MRIVIILFSILCLIPPTFSQYEVEQQVMSKKEQRKLAREFKEAERRAEAEKALILTDSMINQRQFVLEADYISGRSGKRYPVSSHLNFIRVDSSEAIFQIGSMTGIGYNGVGGITVDGTITRYEVNKKVGKKGTSYTINFYILSSLGTYDIFIWVAGSGNADATVRGSISGVINYSGRIVPLKRSRIYKGSSF